VAFVFMDLHDQWLVTNIKHVSYYTVVCTVIVDYMSLMSARSPAV